MRSVIFSILGALLILFGVVGIIIAVIIFKSGDVQSPFLLPVVSGSLIIMGILTLRAIKISYPVHVPLAIGVVLVFFGLMMAAMGFDDLIGGQGENLTVSFIVAGICLVVGLALIRAGRARGHRKLR
jgi:hypothetical protein